MIDPLPLTQCKPLSTEDFERLPVGKYLMEPKIDGWRMQIEVRPDEINAWTRTQHSATGKMPQVEHDLQWLAKNHRFILDGEAVFIKEGGTPDYNLTARCLSSHADVCVMKQRELGMPLTYFVFDMLMIDDHDIRHLPLERRKELMRQYLSSTGAVDLVIGHEPSYEQHTYNFEQYLEGSVLKDLSAPYAGKRHKSWLKWKEIETVDAKIIGYKTATPGSKFDGLIGAIMFKAPDGTEGFCSGMDDETRVFVSNNKDALLGRIIEVKHFGKLVDGYRHPQFQRFRMDK